MSPCTRAQLVTPKQIYQSSRDSIVVVHALDNDGQPSGFGTGFFIADGSTVVTNYHVLEDANASSRAVVREAKAAGVWIFGGGILRQQASIVATNGTVANGPVPEKKAVIGGFSIIETSSREEALAWAARLAAACRCSQEVREIMLDPES